MNASATAFSNRPLQRHLKGGADVLRFELLVSSISSTGDASCLEHDEWRDPA